MGDTFNPKFGAFTALQFVKSNPDSSASGTNTYMTLSSGIGTSAPMPYAGSIVSLAVTGNANVTAGTIAFGVHNAGTAYAQQSGLTATMTTAAGASNIAYSNVRQGVLTFAAGDKIGVNYASATNYAATTIDFDALMVVCFNPV